MSDIKTVPSASNTRTGDPVQSFEKPVLKPVAQTVTGDTAVAQNPAHRFVLAGLPLALLIGVCLVSFGVRTADGLVHNRENRTLAQDREHAETVAASVLGDLVRKPITPDALRFSTQSAFSVRRKASVSEWNVAFDAGSDGQYVVRINAETGRVYGVNQAEPMAVPADSSLPLTPEQARLLSLRYLHTFGIEKADVVPEAQQISLTTMNASDAYTFTYWHRVTGTGRRLIKVAVDRHTGALAHFWNPSGIL